MVCSLEWWRKDCVRFRVIQSPEAHSTKGFVLWRGICYSVCMTYKNIEDRREAWRRWKTRHPERGAELARIQKQAVYANPERQRCSIKDCFSIGERHHPDYSKPKEVIWLCKKHHEIIHHTRVCSICGGKHLARGYCNKHWKQWKKGKL